MRVDDPPVSFWRRFLRARKRYFGLDRPDLTTRQRWRIFLANERRSFDRLLGLSRGPSSCPPPDEAERPQSRATR